ncbi:MAG: TlpA family protein disulfide reductase, partial [Rhizobiaceae bacterium]|nr:TlpA family protein disulfide reductase [Rhizobiaceae bacterium]
MPQKSLFPAPKLILIAALAGVLAGAVAVYFTGGPSGNTPAPATQDAAVSGQADKACEAEAARGKALAAGAVGDVAAMTAAAPSQSLKTLSFAGPDGKPMTLADRQGKTLLVNLWATWCAPCRAEMPALDALETEMGGESFEVMAINVDTGDDTKPKKFLEETGVKALGFYRDSTMGVFNDLKKRGLALGLPVTLLV